jgi:hypothetical protein
MLKRTGFNIILIPILILIPLFFLLSSEIPLWGMESASDIVNQFCKMDYDGFRTQISPNLHIYDLMEAGKNYDEPAWDKYIIISGYEIIRQSQNKNGTITITVSYSELATTNSTPQIEKNIKNETADFILVKINNTWKIRETSVSFPKISKDSSKKWIKKWHDMITNKGIYEGKQLDAEEKSDLLYKLDNISETINELK